MRLLAVDPSLTCTGWAYFGAGSLISCGYTTTVCREVPDKILAMSRGAAVADQLLLDRLAIEVPRIYPRERSKGDPNKLTPLWGIAGGLIALMPSAQFELIEPAKWKGQLPKTIMFARILKRLAPMELERYNRAMGRALDSNAPPGSRAHAGDTLDAIGIGLYLLERL